MSGLHIAASNTSAQTPGLTILNGARTVKMRKNGTLLVVKSASTFGDTSFLSLRIPDNGHNRAARWSQKDKTMATIIITGRRWFERTNGNTYHTARALVLSHDENHTSNAINTPITYGYGNQYYWTGLAALRNSALSPVKPTDNPGCEWTLADYSNELRKAGHEVMDEGYADVKRRKDL